MMPKFEQGPLELTRSFTVEKMEAERVKRFERLTFNPNRYVDAPLAGHSRTVAMALGGYGSGPKVRRTPPDGNPEYMISWCRIPAGQRSFLHYHSATETYIPIVGELSIYWGEREGENEIKLGPLDVLAIPPEVYRGFINRSESETLFMSILGGDGTDVRGMFDPEGFKKRLQEAGVDITAESLFSRL
jgi:quercetin dioxygenase-like cupin family protein